MANNVSMLCYILVVDSLLRVLWSMSIFSILKGDTNG